MLIIVGLGNPGTTYKNTVHNMGFDCVDNLADTLEVSFKKKDCQAKIAEVFIKGEKIILAKPQTYMNNSGISVKQLMGKYGAKPEDVIVIFDDVALGEGALRIRGNGSGGSHNGMKSVVALCGENVARLRIGVGAPPENVPLMNYVLCKLSGDKKKNLAIATKRGAEALEEYIATRSIDAVGNKFNGAK